MTTPPPSPSVGAILEAGREGITRADEPLACKDVQHYVISFPVFPSRVDNSDQRIKIVSLSILLYYKTLKEKTYFEVCLIKQN